MTVWYVDRSGPARGGQLAITADETGAAGIYRRPLTRAFTLRNRAAGPRNLAGMRTAEGEPRRGRRRLAVSLGGGRHRQDPSCRADAGVPGRSGSRAIHTPDPHQLYR